MEAGTPSETKTSDHSLVGRPVDTLVTVGTKDALFLRMDCVNKRSFRLLGPPDSIYIAHLVFHPAGFDGGVGAPLSELVASAVQPYTWETSIDLSHGSELWQLLHPYISLSGEGGIQTDLQVYQAIPTDKAQAHGVEDQISGEKDMLARHSRFGSLIKRACYAVHLISHEEDGIGQHHRWLGRMGTVSQLHSRTRRHTVKYNTASRSIFPSRKREVQGVLLLAARIGQAPLAS